jgi:hypothetical protein
MSDYKKKSLSEIDVYEKWNSLGLLYDIKDEYLSFKLAYTYEMMARYLLSLPDTDDAVENAVETLIFPAIRKLVVGFCL